MTREPTPKVLAKILVLLLAGVLLVGCVRLNFTSVSPTPDATVATLRMQLDRDVGPIDWVRVDASGPAQDAAEAA